MRRRALLGLLGTTATTGGCLSNEGNEYITQKRIVANDGELVTITGSDCRIHDEELDDTLGPFSTSHRVTPRQHLRLVDRYGEVSFSITLHEKGNVALYLAGYYATSREIYNGLTIGDRVTKKWQVEEGIYGFHVRQTGDDEPLDCEIE